MSDHERWRAEEHRRLQQQLKASLVKRVARPLSIDEMAALSRIPEEQLDLSMVIALQHGSEGAATRAATHRKIEAAMGASVLFMRAWQHRFL